MNAGHLLAQLDKISEATDALARLRRFVLDLAVRGKLVEQDPADEHVADLLERRNIATSPDGPFELPASWNWVNVGAVAVARLGKMLDKSKNKGIPRRYLRNVNVRWFDFDLSDILEMRFEDAELPEFELRLGDVLICEGGEPGRAAVWDGRESRIYFQKAIHRVRFPKFVNSYYFVKALRASADDGRLAEYFTGTSIKHFTGKGLSAYLFPLPPLAEQHRIVAKADELIALCDRLDAARTKQEATRNRLTMASLARLNEPDPDLAAFQDHANFALEHLAALTTRPDQIETLRQTILNLAIRGKLVVQDPNDESAHKLLNRIQEKRKELYAAKVIPKPKQLPRLEDMDGLWSLPQGWTWSMLGDLCYKVSDGPHFSPQYVGADEGIPFLSTRNVQMDGFDLTSVKYVSRKDHEEFCKRIRAVKNDIIYTKGGTTGIAKLNDLDIEFSIWVHLAILRIEKKWLLPRYVELALNSPHCYKQSQEYTHGTSNRDLGLTRMVKITVPLPPLAEQHRIVAKVDELMALCDRLKESLTTGVDTRRQLVDMVLHHLLESDADSGASA